MLHKKLGPTNYILRLHSENDLKEKNSKIADWTLKVTTDMEEEKRVHLKSIVEKDILL